MFAALLIASVLAADPTAAELKLLTTFRAEFVQLTPGEAPYPASFIPGDTSRLPANAATERAVRMQPFAMAKYEVPQNLYEAVMGANPSQWKGPRNSVEMVSYADALRFCLKATKSMRTAKLIEANQQIRLPTELEWEYACKAGTTTRYSFGDDVKLLDDYAWHTGNAAGNDPPVGAKKPNPWGLYDMHGYLWEWTSTPFKAESQANAEPAESSHVAKSGSWRDAAELLVSHARQGLPDSEENAALGFRCVLE